jgi:malate dehydrogenase
MGMAGILDSARFRAFIAMELGVSVANVNAFVLGGHGDTMVPSTKYTTVAGIPVEDLIPATGSGRSSSARPRGGRRSCRFLKTGRPITPFGRRGPDVRGRPARPEGDPAVRRAFEGGYEGCDGLFVGLPAKLGAGGVEEVVRFRPVRKGVRGAETVGEAVRELCDAVDRLGF